MRQDASADAAVAAIEVGTGGVTGLGGITGSGGAFGVGGQGTGGVPPFGGSDGTTVLGTGGLGPADASTGGSATDARALCADGPARQPTSSTTITIGGFDDSRGGQCGLATGSFLRQLRGRLVASNFPGIDFVLTGAATLSPGYLATIDILVITSTASNTSAITPLSPEEQEAVSEFIQGGGRFLINSDNSTFGGATTEQANDSILAPVRMTAGGVTFTGKQSMQAADLSSPLVSGRFGTWSTVDANYPGTWKSTGPARVVGYVNGDRSAPALAQLDDGALAPCSGRGVVIADMNSMVDYTGPNTVMLDNILDYLVAGARTSGP